MHPRLSLIFVLSATALYGCASQPAAPLAAADPDAEPTPPSLRSDTCPRPEYPPESVAADEEGTVQIGLLISPQGEVQQSRIDISSGYPRLDAAAADMLERCRFHAAHLNYTPVEAWAALRYTWLLEDEGD